MAKLHLEFEPIETAPRDGTKVMVWCDLPDEGEASGFFAFTEYTEGGGWCVDGVHEVVKWVPKPPRLILDQLFRQNALSENVKENWLNYIFWHDDTRAFKDWEDKEARKAQAIGEMVAEAGEVMGVVVKARRKNKPVDRAKVVDELGDTMWGVVAVMKEFDITLGELLAENQDKLDKKLGLV